MIYGIGHLYETIELKGMIQQSFIFSRFTHVFVLKCSDLMRALLKCVSLYRLEIP